MENENTPNTPYEDPELIVASHGDRQLLDRLVGRTIAQERLSNADTDEERLHIQRTLDVMESEVERRRHEIGIVTGDDSGRSE